MEKRFKVTTRADMYEIADYFLARGYKKIADIFYVMLLEKRNKMVVIQI